MKPKAVPSTPEQVVNHNLRNLVAERKMLQDALRVNEAKIKAESRVLARMEGRFDTPRLESTVVRFS